MDPGGVVEVWGLPEDSHGHTVERKLHRYFSTCDPGGGGEVKVLYPCYAPGQAFIVLKDTEAVGRILKSSHVLMVNHQTYRLKVKAPDGPQVDLPVEATVHLNSFSDHKKVREILLSHDFQMTALDGSRVRISGSLLKLGAARTRLEMLRNAQKQNRPPPPSSEDTSQSEAPSSSPQQPGSESFVVDAEVLMYAKHLRKRDIEDILRRHGVRMEQGPLGHNVNVTLQGKGAKTAVTKLQSSLHELSSGLRTQEVALKDMDHEGRALWRRIQQENHVYKSVMVCRRSDTLRLIGPSAESYEVKQQLMGRTGDQSGRTGRTGDQSGRTGRTVDQSGRTGRTAGQSGRTGRIVDQSGRTGRTAGQSGQTWTAVGGAPRWRSTSVPPVNGRRTDGGQDVSPKASSVEAQGHSVKHHHQQEAASHAGYRGRNSSETRDRMQTETTKDLDHPMDNGHDSFSSPKKFFTQKYDHFKRKFKSEKVKK